MIRKIRASSLSCLATALVVLTVLGFTGCSSDGNATDSVPDDGGPSTTVAAIANDPVAAALKKAGMNTKAIKQFIAAKKKSGQDIDPKKSQVGKVRGR
jgi:hypothetical protein